MEVASKAFLAKLVKTIEPEQVLRPTSRLASFAPEVTLVVDGPWPFRVAPLEAIPTVAVVPIHASFVRPIGPNAALEAVIAPAS